MKHLRSLIALAALAGCVTEPVEHPPFFEAAVYQLQDDVPLMTFQGEDDGLGWIFAPDPTGTLELEIPDGVSTGFEINTEARRSNGSGFVAVKLRVYGLPVPPRPATYGVAHLEDPLDPDHYGTMFGRFSIADTDGPQPGWWDGATFYDIIEGTVTVDDIGPDAPASGTIAVRGEAREAKGRPPVLRLEGSFRIRNGVAIVCALNDWECLEGLEG